MGQTVLKNHVLGGKRYPPHGFWFGSRGDEGIQLPVQDLQVIAEIRSLVRIARTTQPGLSVVVPYLRAGLDEDAIIDAVLRNYYFPILAGQLVVEVGTVTISQATFHTVFSSRPAGKSGQLIALEFVEAVSAALKSEPDFATASPITQGGITEKAFTPEKIKEMKAVFQSGKLVHVRFLFHSPGSLANVSIAVSACSCRTFLKARSRFLFSPVVQSQSPVNPDTLAGFRLTGQW